MASKSLHSSNDPRLVEHIKKSTLASAQNRTSENILIGHADDEGIRLNNGRPGSAQAPDTIRAEFSKLTPGRSNFPSIYDAGNIAAPGTISERQSENLKMARALFKQNHRLFALGGGHDHAYSDVGGFLENYSKNRPLVINIDAHLDLRPLDRTPTSGTPFFQLLEKYSPFDLIQIGIQPHSSSLLHHEHAKKNKVKVYMFAESHGSLLSIFKKISAKAKSRPVFLSIDMDAFSSAYAPGTSAASPIGLDPNEFIKIMPLIAQKLNIRGLGIYEVSPPLDSDNKTSKLAAILLHSFFLHAKVS